jgi:molecular chaperone HscB
MKTHFELFGLEPAYALEADRLERAYRQVQATIHPDRFAQAGDAARRASVQWSARVNEAYRTLKDPLERARYLLELQGVDLGMETDSAMPAEFLARQMELRESLELAAAEKDAGALERLHAALRAERAELLAGLGELIDARRDYAGAAGLTRKLKFLDKLDREIDATLAEIEA